VGSVHLKAHEQPEKDRPVGTDGLIWTYLSIGSTLRKILVARVVSSALPSSALASEAARIEPACLGTTGVEQGIAGGNGADGVDEVSKTSPAPASGNVP
jgi:hypothetical protein